jgi:hypothetical protein
MLAKLDKKPINNAHRGLRVTIKPQDISAGQRLNPEACAAANALCNMQGVEAAKVHRTCVYLKRNGRWHRYRTSAALRLETIIFDRKGEFMPGEFDLLPVPISDIIPKSAHPRANSAPKRKPSHPQRHRALIPGTRPSANGFRG